MIPARPPALVSWENSSANNAYVFTSPAPLSGNRSVLRTNTLAASDARFGITGHYGDTTVTVIMTLETQLGLKELTIRL